MTRRVHLSACLAQDDSEGADWLIADRAEAWLDPSENGILTSVLAAAECGDDDELSDLISQLSVSINTPNDVSFLEPTVAGLQLFADQGQVFIY